MTFIFSEATHAAQVIALKNPGFEAPADPRSGFAPDWHATRHAGENPYTFELMTKGCQKSRQCIRVTQNGQQFFGTVSQATLSREFVGKTIRASFKVRTSKLGPGGAFVFVQSLALGDVRDNFNSRTIAGRNGWTTLSVEGTMGLGVDEIRFGATITDVGQLWIDDAKLEVLD